MRVGFNAVSRDTLTSMKFILKMFDRVLRERHEVVPFPDDYYETSPLQRRKMAEDLVRACDVILAPADPSLLHARETLNAPVAMCVMVLGHLPRGYFNVQGMVHQLRASDVLVANSRPDAAIARLLFENATVRVVPFAYDETRFYPPSDEEGASMRSRLAIPSRAPVVLYAGRCTVEKNVHTVLKVFAAVRAAVPDAHLVLAGPVEDSPFMQFGVYPLQLSDGVYRMIRRLGLSGRVHMPGPLRADDLRAAYGAADVVMNLTLNTDENFGLGQVEAMACGKPIVATRWGGLQDSIVHGETGYHVSTMLTGNGVRANWWEAANRVVQLLRDPERRAAFGARATEVAAARYSPPRMGQVLTEVLEDALFARRRVRELLRVTDFTRQLWATRWHNPHQPRPGRRGPEIYGFYRRLMTPYSGLTENTVPAGQPLAADQVVILANPVAWNPDGTLAVNDALFPCDVQVPSPLEDAVRAVLEALGREPVTTVGALADGAERPGDAREALAWMEEAGLVLRGDPRLDAIDPALAHEAGTTPVVSIHRVDFPADVVYVAPRPVEAEETADAADADAAAAAGAA